MDGFRQLIKGWLGKVLLGLVVFVFVIYGAESLMVLATRPQPVAEVNGEEVSRQLLDARIEQERQRQAAQMRERVSELDLSAESLAPEVLDGIVDRIILSQRADALNLAVSDRIVMQWITQMPQFQQDGVFSEDILKVLLSRNNYSLPAFMAEVKKDYVLRQLQQGLVDSFFMTDHELSQLVALQEQTRSFQYAVLQPDAFLEQVTVTDEDLKSYYEQNSEQFRTKEKARFEYVLLRAEAFASEVEVTEEDIAQAFEDEVAQAQADEQRRASHILISPDSSDTEITASDETGAKGADDLAYEKIKELQAELAAGADFAELAKAHSMDPGSASQGGDLGFATAGTMVPSFDAALFDLKVGEQSEIIKSEFGYHLIKLLEIKTAEIPVLADIRDDLVAQIKKEKSLTLFEEKVDILNTLAFESGDLVPLAERFDLTVETSEWIERLYPRGLFADEKLVRAAFADEVIKDGFNTDAIVLPGDDRALVVRVKEHAPAVIESFDAVKGRVQELVSLSEAKKLATKQGRAAIASLKAGGDLTAVSAEYGLEWTEHEQVKRLASDAPRPLLQHVFKMSRPNDAAKSFDGVEFDQGFAVIEVKSVMENETALSDAEQDNMRLFLSGQLGQIEIQNYLDFHVQASDVSINL